eukprot:scaffold364_cov401-Prasinococcus_capsulatus_cf.AAC.8
MFVPYANTTLAANIAANVLPSNDTRRSASTLRDPGSSWAAVGTSSSAAKLVVYLRRLGAESFSVSPVSKIAARTLCMDRQVVQYTCQSTLMCDNSIPSMLAA